MPAHKRSFKMERYITTVGHCHEDAARWICLVSWRYWI